MIPCGTVPEPKVTARKTSASLGAHSRSSNSPRSAQANEQAPNALGADDFNNRRQVNIKSMFFIDKLQKVLFAKSQSDRTCFIRVQKFLEQQVLSNRLGLDAFDKALAFAEEATTGENPNALFMSLVRKQLGFTRKAR